MVKDHDGGEGKVKESGGEMKGMEFGNPIHIPSLTAYSRTEDYL